MELFEACEQVQAILNNSNFREGLLQLMRKERAIWAAKGTWLDLRRNPKDPAYADSLEFETSFIKGSGLRNYLLEQVIMQLPQPPVICADDLQEISFHQLSGIRKDNEKVQYERFVNFALLQIQEVAYGPWFSLGNWRVACEEEMHDSVDYCTLPNGFDVNIEWSGGIGELPEIEAWIWGSSTESAVYQVSKEIEPTIQTVLRLIKLAVTSRDAEEKHNSDFFIPTIGWLFAIRPQIELALKCHYNHNEFATRVKHAIMLAQCSDTHPNQAIAISFCVSAIEALLCEGTEDKGDQLRKRIPAILQFQGKGKEFRSINKAIIALYDIRSQAVHGSRLRATQEQLQSATRLLAAILRGVLEWAVHTADETTLPEEQQWTAELRKITSDPKNFGKLTGVTNELSEHMNLFVKSFEIDHE